LQERSQFWGSPNEAKSGSPNEANLTVYTNSFWGLGLGRSSAVGICRGGNLVAARIAAFSEDWCNRLIQVRTVKTSAIAGFLKTAGSRSPCSHGVLESIPRSPIGSGVQYHRETCNASWPGRRSNRAATCDPPRRKPLLRFQDNRRAGAGRERRRGGC
jgi:hypothetical protein